MRNIDWNYLVFLAACVWVVVAFTGCASTPMQVKRSDTLDCVKDFTDRDIDAEKAFEICRQVYKLKKINE